MLSVTIIAFNEEKDLPRCLESVQFADEIILVDSDSTDKTQEIAKRHGVKFFNQRWQGYGQQKNFAMDQAKSEWVLNIDADEVVTPALKQEILTIINDSNAADCYAVARKTYYMGKWIRFGGWYPNYVTRLCRKSISRWTEPNVHEALTTTGTTKKLQHPLLHYTFEDIADQIRGNLRYARQGAQDLHQKDNEPGHTRRHFPLLIRYVIQLIIRPWIKFFETYLYKCGFLDGLQGFIISVNAAHSIFMKYSFLIEMHDKVARLATHDTGDS